MVWLLLLLGIVGDWPIKPIVTPDVKPTGKWVIRPIAPVTKPTAKPKAVKPPPLFTMAVTEWSAKPAGWRPFNVNGDWHPSYSKLYHHVFNVHSTYMPKGLTDDQFAQLSYDELWSIHSTIHCIEQGFIPSRNLGRWTTVCPVDQSQPCVHTWTWEIPKP